MKLNIIVGMCKNGGIGFKGGIPWYFKKDMKFFKNITSGISDEDTAISIILGRTPDRRLNDNDNVNKNAIVMGRTTWDSIPNKPLKNRDNIILTKSNNCEYIEYLKKNNIYNSNVSVFNDFDTILKSCYSKNYNNLWIIGGESIYSLMMLNKYYYSLIDNIYITEIDADYKCDVYSPFLHDVLKNDFYHSILFVDREKNTNLLFNKYERKGTINKLNNDNYYYFKNFINHPIFHKSSHLS